MHFDDRITEAQACVSAMIDLFEKPYILMKGNQWHIYKSLQFILKHMRNTRVMKNPEWQAYLLLLDNFILAGLKQRISMKLKMKEL